MLYTTSTVVVVCHIVDEHVVMLFYTTSIVVVVCHVVHDEYSGGRVSCCTRLV